MATDPITYQLTEADIVAGNDLWRRAQVRPRRLVTVMIVLWLLYTGLAILCTDRTPSDIILSMLICGATVLAVFVVVFALARWQSPRLSVKYFRASRAAQQETQLSWTDDKVRFEQSDAYQDWPWSDAKQWAENGTVLVLLQTGPIFRALPKRVLSEQQLADIRACLARAGVPRAKLFFF
jgi:hypothetical protein